MIKKYIFFDLDGTLTDPAVGITNSVMYALDKFGIHVSERSDLYKFIGPPLIEAFMQYYGFTAEKAKLAVTYYREYFSGNGIFENGMYDGIESLLAELKKEGRYLVVATSKPEVFSIRILDHFNIRGYFKFVAGSTLQETRTAKSEVIEYAVKELGITDMNEIIMVGDRSQDIIGAKANGIESVGVLYGYGSEDEIKNAGADYTAGSVAELGELLKTM